MRTGGMIVNRVEVMPPRRTDGRGNDATAGGSWNSHARTHLRQWSAQGR